MKVDMIKQAGGVFVPASDEAADYLNKFKTGEMYPVELKLPRNHSFHRKVFAFFEFVFQYWSANKTHWENMSEPKQKYQDIQTAVNLVQILIKEGLV